METMTEKEYLKGLVSNRKVARSGGGVHLSEKDKLKKRTGRKYEQLRKNLKQGSWE